MLDQRRPRRRGGRDQHGTPEHGRQDHRRHHRVHRQRLHPRPPRHRLVLQALGRHRRRALEHQHHVLRRVPRHRQRPVQQVAADAARRDPGRRPHQDPRRGPQGPDADPGVRHALLVQVSRRDQGPAPVGRRHRAQLRARQGLEGHQDQHPGDRRIRQVLVGEGAPLQGAGGRGRPARALHPRLRHEQSRVQGTGGHGAEEARRAHPGALLDARPHRGARSRGLAGRRTR